MQRKKASPSGGGGRGKWIHGEGQSFRVSGDGEVLEFRGCVNRIVVPEGVRKLNLELLEEAIQERPESEVTVELPKSMEILLPLSEFSFAGFKTRLAFPGGFPENGRAMNGYLWQEAVRAFGEDAAPPKTRADFFLSCLPDWYDFRLGVSLRYPAGVDALLDALEERGNEDLSRFAVRFYFECPEGFSAPQTERLRRYARGRIGGKEPRKDAPADAPFPEELVDAALRFHGLDPDDELFSGSRYAASDLKADPIWAKSAFVPYLVSGDMVNPVEYKYDKVSDPSYVPETLPWICDTADPLRGEARQRRFGGDRQRAAAQDGSF